MAARPMRACPSPYRPDRVAARAFSDADPVDAIMAVMAEAFDPAFGEAWNRRQVSDALVLGTCRHLLIDPDGHVAEIVAGGQAAGFILAREVLDEDELLLFAIAPRWRGRGLGTILLDAFLETGRARGATRAFLEMREGNRAEHLYTARGFERVGVRPGYYRGADGLRYDALSFSRTFDL